MNYPEPLQALIPGGTEMELAAGQPQSPMREALARFDLAAAIAPRKLVDPSLADACRCGLWLAHNYLDESHAISQGIETPTGSFWHAIMHRREGDFDNACYWFCRVRSHEVYFALQRAAAECDAAASTVNDRALARLTQGSTWDPAAFVEVVRSVVAGKASDSTAMICRLIARREWELLLDYCYRGAVGQNIEK
ncbi:MAG: hypothetical protein K8T91_06150 [Planctomycetes bacterium]|nr:hypothetical protein [Planctomycetota bacterium]